MQWLSNNVVFQLNSEKEESVMDHLSNKTNGLRVSDHAAEKFREIIESMEDRPAGVRIYNSGGCCGSSVQMELANGPQPGEVQLDIEEIPFFVAADFMPELDQVTIDFSDGGFRLLGYNRSEGCCGG
jgi:Fe-S cluster assembly iron-binding protein IscA